MTKQQKMFAVIQQWEQSQQTKAEFARRHKIPLQTFHYWCRRYQQAHTPSERATFIELPSLAIAPEPGSDQSLRSPRLSLEFADGLRVNIY